MTNAPTTHETPAPTADKATRPGEPTRFADATDGVKLAIYEYGDSDRPTVLFVHGYPDDHSVWEPVIALTAGDFHVVTYDVRGTGASGQPAKRGGYAMSQLRDDLATVISLTSPDSPVHLVAHDWGSIQSWAAVSDSAFANKLASFTSVSGPGLDMAVRGCDVGTVTRVSSHVNWLTPGTSSRSNSLSSPNCWCGAVSSRKWSRDPRTSACRPTVRSRPDAGHGVTQ